MNSGAARMRICLTEWTGSRGGDLDAKLCHTAPFNVYVRERVYQQKPVQEASMLALQESFQDQSNGLCRSRSSVIKSQKHHLIFSVDAASLRSFSFSEKNPYFRSHVSNPIKPELRLKPIAYTSLHWISHDLDPRRNCTDLSQSPGTSKNFGKSQSYLY